MEDVVLTLTLDLDFRETGQEDSIERAAFEKSLLLDLCSAAGIGASHMSITNLSPGSVVVTLRIRAAGLFSYRTGFLLIYSRSLLASRTHSFSFPRRRGWCGGFGAGRWGGAGQSGGRWKFSKVNFI